MSIAFPVSGFRLPAGLNWSFVVAGLVGAAAVSSLPTPAAAGGPRGGASGAGASTTVSTASGVAFSVVRLPNGNFLQSSSGGVFSMPSAGIPFDTRTASGALAAAQFASRMLPVDT